MNVVCSGVRYPECPFSLRADLADRRLYQFSLLKVHSYRRLFEELAIVFFPLFITRQTRSAEPIMKAVDRAASITV